MSRPRIVCVGGGPAGLYFAILMKKAFPAAELRVVERNRPDDTFGWGVVFSDETLANFERADPESYRAITARFRSWRDIETHYRGAVTVSTGHGFAALERRELLLVLQQRCRELGVELEFEREVADLRELAGADLVVGADGANSLVRGAHAAQFGPRLDRRRCRYSWLGTDLELRAFTFIFEETPHGLFQVHAYPFAPGRSTWIVECRAEVLARAGLEGASEADTVAFCERLFARYLDGHRLFANRSQWRTFVTVRCARWHCGSTVLLGDAAHTAHFSIGSGTKLAMEDAIALSEAFRRHGAGAQDAALAEYEAARRLEVMKLQRAAQTSLEWFENSARYLAQPPIQFTFNLLTRSKRITYDNLRQRDPELIERVNEWFAESEGRKVESSRMEPGSARFPRASRSAPPSRHDRMMALGPGSPPRRPSMRSPGPTPPPIFTPFRLRGLELANRIVVSPMCQYSAVDGTPQDWHLVHLGSRAIGGAALVMTEMTDVSPEGRITHACTGMYAPEHVAAWRRVVDFVHANSAARIGLQLAHAGRKGSVRHPWEGEDVPLRPAEGAWQTLAPSALPYHPHWPAPKAMERYDMDSVVEAFARATRMAREAGFDLIELHMAHGYLLSSFLSPLANQRRDAYGGSLENRMRFPLEVFSAMRAIWPEDKPLAVRISATDWLEEEGRGFTADEAVELARALAAAGCDLVDVSSSGNSPESRPEYGRMYHVPFAERIRHAAGIPVAVVGALLGADHANTVLAAGRADLAVLARAHLRDPYLTLHAAEQYGFEAQPWPGQYLLARPRPRQP